MNTLETYEHVRENFVINYKDKLGETKTTAVAKNLIYNGTPITTESDVEDLVREYVENEIPEAQLILQGLSVMASPDGLVVMVSAKTGQTVTKLVSNLNDTTDVLDTSLTEKEIYDNFDAYVEDETESPIGTVVAQFGTELFYINGLEKKYVDVMGSSVQNATMLRNAVKLATSLINTWQPTP
jgi:hypothetical protein